MWYYSKRVPSEKYACVSLILRARFIKSGLYSSPPPPPWKRRCYSGQNTWIKLIAQHEKNPFRQDSMHRPIFLRETLSWRTTHEQICQQAAYWCCSYSSLTFVVFADQPIYLQMVLRRDLILHGFIWRTQAMAWKTNEFLVSKETVVLRLNYHRERFRKLTFRALVLRQSE